MPRPPRRTRAAASQTTAAAPTAAQPLRADDGNGNRRRTRKSDVSRDPSVSSDLYGVSDREVKRQASLRQAAAATSTSAQRAEATSNTENEGGDEQSRRSAQKRRRSAAPVPTPALASASRQTRQTRGPDESGIDILDDDVFGDMNTSFGGNGLDGLDSLDDLSDLSSLGSSPSAAAPGSAAGSARGGTRATHSTDNTASSFNVGLFRRGRPRQSSVHSRDDAPIRPSSRGPATPSISSTFSLGTFRRRAREPSILGRRRRDTSRQSSRDRGGETSASELDDAGPFTSDVESSSMPTRASRAQVQDSSSLSVATSTANTTSMLMTRIRNRPTRTKTAATATTTTTMTTTTTKKRKSEEGHREDELPKRRTSGRVAAAQAAEAAAEAAAQAAAATPSRGDADILPSIELGSSMPPSTPPSQISRSAGDRERYSTPVEVDPEIMAPPASSGSSSASPSMWPSLRSLANGVRRGNNRPAVAAPAHRHVPELANDDSSSDLSSPPSLTHSPNYRHAQSRVAAATKVKGRAAQQAGTVQPLTTEALTALLPQRRHRARGGGRWAAASDDGEGDGDDEAGELDRSALLSEDDDELAHGPVRYRPRRGRGAAQTPAAASKAAMSLATSANRRTAPNSRKKAVKRTYGSRSFSDKENQNTDADADADANADANADGSTFSPLPDNAFEDEETVEAGKQAGRKERHFGEELEKAAKKFKEVDRWALEFESVSRSSSPVGAR